MRKRIWFVLMMMALCAVVAFAADVTGKWTAQLPPPPGAAARGNNTGPEVTFNFKVDGETLTGTVTESPGGREVEIKEGRVSGDDISFATVFVRPRGDGVEVRFTYKGKVKGNEIEFTREVGGRAGVPTINFNAKKVE